MIGENEPISSLRFIQQNVLQLLHGAKERGLSIDSSSDIIDLFLEPIDLSNKQQIIDRRNQFLKHAEAIKKRSYEPMVVGFSGVFYFALVAAIGIYLLVIFNKLLYSNQTIKYEFLLSHLSKGVLGGTLPLIHFEQYV